MLAHLGHLNQITVALLVCKVGPVSLNVDDFGGDNLLQAFLIDVTP